MKYLIILIILLVFWAFVFSRLRPYIAMARRVLGIIRNTRQVSNIEGTGSARPTVKNEQKLIRCATCKTWIPASRAILLRTQTVAYCSHECLENAATDINTRRAAGGRK